MPAAAKITPALKFNGRLPNISMHMTVSLLLRMNAYLDPLVSEMPAVLKAKLREAGSVVDLMPIKTICLIGQHIRCALTHVFTHDVSSLFEPRFCIFRRVHVWELRISG